MTGRGLSRLQYVGATAGVIVAGCVLVCVLSLGFARGSSTPERQPSRSYTFEGTSSGLVVVSGDIVVERGRATATRASATNPAVALVEDLVAQGRLTVIAADPGPGWGLVVRWEDDQDHWFVTVGENGVLELGAVRGGDAQVLDVALSPLRAGAEVDVRFNSKRVDVRVGGDLVASARGRAVRGQRVGLWAGSPGPAWDDLALGPRPTPVIRDVG